MALPPPLLGLMDDLIGEILLRIAPEDPECLVRASKPWRRLLSDPDFPRRYREFHRAPPLLGFFHNEYHPTKYGGGRFIFIPIKEASGPPILNRRVEPDSRIIDFRHGCVLLINWNGGGTTGLINWDPITDSHDHIGLPKIMGSLYRFTVAVLCAVDGCDHLGCRGGPSLVVFVRIDSPNQLGATASARVYSKETGAWNAGVSSVHSFGLIKFGCQKTIEGSLLAGDALYFILEDGRTILKYDLAGSRLSLMSSLPDGNMVLTKGRGRRPETF